MNLIGIRKDKSAFTKSRVLLVTETPPGTANGFGVTLECIFKGTQHDVIYTDAGFKTHGDRYGYKLAQVPYHKSKKFFFQYKLGLIPEWRGKYSRNWVRMNLLRHYDYVYTFIYSTSCLEFASWISKEKKIPLIVHLADYSVSFKTSRIGEILINCRKLFCITDDMKSEFESSTGRKDIEVLHNGAEERCYEIPTPNRVHFDSENPFRLCFIGGLFSHLHGDCIEDIFKAVTEIRKRGFQCEFHLFGQRQPQEFLKELIKIQGVKHHGLIMPLDKRFEIMEKAHCFILPSSFNQQNHCHYRYSFPTKLPELIASGRPIISYGPSDTSANRLLARNNLGIRIHKRSISTLTNTIIKTIESYAESIAKSSFLRTDGPKKFSAIQVRNKFSKIMNQI